MTTINAETVTLNFAPGEWVLNDGDYMSGGVPYCGKCNTPKGRKIEILGTERVIHFLCGCEAQKSKDERERREALEESRRIERLKTSGIQDPQMRDWTFETDDGANPAMRSKVRKYAENWKRAYTENLGLLFWGDVGTGKTFYAACIANELTDSGVPVMMTSFPKIIRALTALNIEDKNEYINSLNSYALLIIDDLGTERQTSFANEIVFSVIDARYRIGKPLIVTTNLTLDGIRDTKNNGVDLVRIYDRILEMCAPVKFEGDSRRISVYESKKALMGRIFDN